MFFQKLEHEHALKQIGCYLKAISEKGLIMKASEKLLKIDNFLDANFSRMYGHKVMGNPVGVKCRTGCVIMVSNCPIMWKFELQSETAPSSIEAEIIAIAQICHKLSLSWMESVSWVKPKVFLLAIPPFKFQSTTIMQDIL